MRTRNQIDDARQAPPPRNSSHVGIPAIEPNFNRRVHCLFGLVWDAVSIEQAVETLNTSIALRRRCHLSTPNANFLRLSQSNCEFRDAVLASDLCTLDGMPLVCMARAMGARAARRVSGADLFARLQRQSSVKIRGFFLGADERTGQRLRARLGRAEFGVCCVGALAPGFGSIEEMGNPAVISEINRTNPDLLSVSIGVPKGLVWLARHERSLTSPVICNLGATIHFAAGTLRRAPAWLGRIGLEWLWRIAVEPRLFTRYARDFLALARILTMRLAPGLMLKTLFRPSAAQLAAAAIGSNANSAITILTLGGAWSESNLAPLREHLAQAARVGGDLTINLDQVTHVDSAFLGLMLLAYGHQRRCSRRFALRAAHWRIRASLRFACCDFLFAAPAGELPQAPAPHAQLLRANPF